MKVLRGLSLGRTRIPPVQTRRSPESMVSYGVPPSVHDSTVSPLPNANRRISVYGGGGGGLYSMPDYPKPPTPYEDKVIPTLRNRLRGDGSQPGNSLMASTDGTATGGANDETESVAGGLNAPSNDDAIAELNQAEMIEANQMMVVFDKQLVIVKDL